MKTTDLFAASGRGPRGYAAILVMAALLFAGPATTATRDGAVKFVEVRKKDRSLKATESKILRQDLRVSTGIVSRTAVHLFVAEGRDVWDRDVAPGLAAVLKSGPDAVMQLGPNLPSSVAVAGPYIDGGVVEFYLPGGRGDGLMAVYFPDLIDRRGGDPELLDATVPNKGLYVAGVSVEATDDPETVGLYVPSRPKGMTRGSPPDVSPRDLPRDGEGDLVIFRGKGGSGSDAEPLRSDLERLFGRDRLTPGDLRSFPKGKDTLDRDLKTFRVEARTLEADDGWYRTLARDPDDWEFETVKLAHPVRYLAFSAPVELEGADGGRRTLIFGGVALYAPLVLSARQASLYLGVKAQAFAEAVHGGEIPFLRDGDAVFFHRAHLDRWKAGRALTGEGKTYGSKGSKRRVEELASDLRSKGIGRAAKKPLPRRFQESPDDAPDDAPPVRGRIYSDDLNQWLQHFDRRADLPGTEPVFAMKKAGGGARFAARFGGGGRARSSGGEPLLELVELYPVDPTCVPGQQVIASVNFVVDQIPKGEEATLKLEWSLVSGSNALVRFSAEIIREAGEHEVHVEAGCPSERGTGTFEAVLTWEETGLTVSQTTSVVSR